MTALSAHAGEAGTTCDTLFLIQSLNLARLPCAHPAVVSCRGTAATLQAERTRESQQSLLLAYAGAIKALQRASNTRKTACADRLKLFADAVLKTKSGTRLTRYQVRANRKGGVGWGVQLKKALQALYCHVFETQSCTQHDVQLIESAGVPWYFSRGYEIDSHCGWSLFRLWFLDFGCPACGEGLGATFGHEPVNPGPFGTGVVCFFC